MGGDKSGDWVELGASAIGAAIGTAMAPGPGTIRGWQMGGQVGKMGSSAMGLQKGDGGVASKSQSIGNTASSVYSMSRGGPKGFSGITDAGKGVDVGGTNAFGNPLGSGKGLNKAITDSGNMMDRINKAIEYKDIAGSLLGFNQQNPNPQVLMQQADTSITPQNPLPEPQQLSQIVAAQLQNLNQNRIAFRRFA